MKELKLTVIILLIVGGLNWGLIGLLGINFIYTVLGGYPILERGVYFIVGLAAVAQAYWKFCDPKK